jgi:CRP-like cAMP-binding protein
MPMPKIQDQYRNRLLSGLPRNAFEALAPHLEAVDLPVRHSLVEPDEVTQYVCFIEDGLGSVVATSTDEERVEVGHVGRDGMSGYHVLLDVDRTPNKTFMQVAGSGYLLPVSRLASILSEFPTAQKMLLRYVHCAELQLAHSALANARYNIPERLARWLLMSHDRLEGNDLPLTHEFLALMLGVRRSGVTGELHVLEGAHAIRATRGNIHVRDRTKLEDMAGGCYGLPEREYERLLGFSFRSR